jgi:hypothetical protein
MAGGFIHLLAKPTQAEKDSVEDNDNCHRQSDQQSVTALLQLEFGADFVQRQL